MDSRPKTVKLLKENKGRKFPDIGFDNNVLGMTPNTQATKGTVDEPNKNYIKQDFCTLKGAILTVKTMDWRKYLSTIYLIMS